MQPVNAIAVRPPVNTPTSPAPAAPEPVTAESLGWQLRGALPPLRLHSVSLYDEEANVLWLSEGALGPDEHSLVTEAIEALGTDATLNCYENGLEDGRAGVFLPVRSPQGGLVGLAMILADIKSVGDGVVERMMTPQVRTIMQRLAVLLRPAPAVPTPPVQVDVLQVLELEPEADRPAVQNTPPAQNGKQPAVNGKLAHAVLNGKSPAPVLNGKPAAPPVLSPQAVDDILEFELTPDVPAPVLHAATIQTSGARPHVNGSAALTPIAAPPGVPGPVASNAAAASLVEPLALPVSKPAPSAIASNVSPVPTPTPAASALPPTVNAPVSAPETFETGLFASPAALSAPVEPIANATTSKGQAANATGTLVSTGTARTLGTAATTTSRVLALPDGVSLLLEVQPFTKLRAGGRTRRYEVLARSSHPNRVPAGFDNLALQRTLTWLGSNRAAWNSEPTSFTLNLSISTLEDERFPQFVASNLKAHGIAADNIGFEIAEPLCLQRRAQVERFVTLCDKLGCFVVIDDFSLDSSVVSLLRSKALRMVKIDPKLTSVALKDKLAQAMVVAIAQAVKVLGIHCAAKRVDSQASLQWLNAIGCDFAQGAAVAQVQPLESLGAQPATDPGKAS